MTGRTLLPRIAAELSEWEAAGQRPRFWLRDDDAVEPTAALDRLLEMCAAEAVPVTLAVIPALAKDALADRLESAPAAEVAVHGWRHRNHAAAGRKSCELGADRPAGTVLGDLAQGRERIGTLFGRKAVPLLVPPWNRIDQGLLPALPDLGFEAVSCFGDERPGPPGLRVVNTHVDLIDWRGTRGGRDAGALDAEVAARLAVMRDRGSGVMGFLTHHLVHDAAAWDFLGVLLRETTRAGARWVASGGT